MLSSSFWVDWTIPGSVEWLRELLPTIVAPADFIVVERRAVMTSAGWASFSVRRAARPESQPAGVIRAQDVANGRVQVIFAPQGGRTDPSTLIDLNDVAVLLYGELVLRGVLAPPPPLNLASRPLGR